MTPRRSLLRAGGFAGLGLLAGCLATAPRSNGGSSGGSDGNDGGSSGGGDDGSGLPSDGGSGGGDAGGTRPEGTGGPGVSIVARDDPPDLGVRPSVEVVDDVATAEHPPRFRVTIANEGDEAVGVGEGRAAFFEYVTAETDQLILLPTAGEADYPAEPDCWRLTEPLAITEEYRTVRVAAGASERRDVSLYGAPVEDACLPVGEHRFETTISVGPADGIASDGESARWGFSVLLE